MSGSSVAPDSKLMWARVFSAATSWLHPLLEELAPQWTTSTGEIGRAVLAVSELDGAGPRRPTSGGINRLAAAREEDA